MKPVMFLMSVVVLAVSVTAQAEPAKPPPPAEEPLPVVRPQIRQILQSSPAQKALVPQQEELEIVCKSVVRAAPAPGQEPGIKQPPTTVEKEVRMNRILLVDLGERELKTREGSKGRVSRSSSETQAPECPEPHRE